MRPTGESLGLSKVSISRIFHLKKISMSGYAFKIAYFFPDCKQGAQKNLGGRFSVSQAEASFSLHKGQIKSLTYLLM